MGTVTKTIGSASRDYTTIAGWEADLDNGAIYASSDDAVGEMYADSDFSVTATTTINGGGTIGLGSVRLTVGSGEEHDGTANTGVRVRATSGFSTLLDFYSIGGNPRTMELFEIDCNSQDIDAAVINFIGTGNGDATISRMIIHDNGGAGTKGAILVNSLQAGYAINVINNIIYDVDASGTGSDDAFGIAFQLATLTSKTFNAHNNTIYNIKNTGGTGNAWGLQTDLDGAENKFKNNLIVGTNGTASGTIEDFDTTISTTTNISNNLSSDTTAPGSGSLVSKTASNQFVSTTGGSENLLLKTGADAIDAGTDLVTTPTGVNLDIISYDRDGGGVTWDIGANEFIAAAGTTHTSLPLMGVG